MRSILRDLACYLWDTIVRLVDALTSPLYHLAEDIENSANRRTKQNSGESEYEDPCENCLRWDECNGVDRDNCPIC